MSKDLKAKEERRFDIVLAAIRLFSRDGFYATRVPDIAREVGMSAGNIITILNQKKIWQNVQFVIVQMF